MSQNILNRIEQDAARFGFLKVRGVGVDHHKTAWQITCSGCRAQFRAYWSPQTSPALMVKNMRVRQWDVGQGERPLCPQCAHPDRSKAPAAKPEGQSFDRHIGPGPKTTMFAAFTKYADKIMAPPPLPMAHMGAETGKLLVSSLMATSTGSPSAQLADRASKNALIDGLLDSLEETTTRMDEIKQEQETSWTEFRDRRTAAKLARKEARMAAHRQARAAEEAEREKVRQAVHDAQQAQRAQHAQQAQQNNKEETAMKENLRPNPKIMHSVFQSLDSILDVDKKLYRVGYSDERVARECGTTAEIVTALRKECYCELAEDPRLSTLRDDVELAQMQLDEFVKNANRGLSDLRSRIDQASQSGLR